MKRRTLTRDDLLKSPNLSRDQHERIAAAARLETDAEVAALRDIDAEVAKLDREVSRGPLADMSAAMERAGLARRRAEILAAMDARRRD